MFDSRPTKRARRLTTKILASPTLPLLGWTKAVETVVASGPTVNWMIYAALVTLLWIFADDLRDVAEEATDA